MPIKYDKSEKTGFSLDGAKEIDDLMQQLPMEFQAQILYKLTRQGANIVKKELEANAPESEKDHIRKSIQVRKDEDEVTAVKVGITSKKGFQVRFAEYGTQKRETDETKANRGAITNPEPFVRKSIESKIQEVIKTFNENFLKVVKKVVKKYKKTNKK